MYLLSHGFHALGVLAIGLAGSQQAKIKVSVMAMILSKAQNSLPKALAVGRIQFPEAICHFLSCDPLRIMVVQGQQKLV